jgi:hypothetical protein
MFGYFEGEELVFFSREVQPERPVRKIAKKRTRSKNSKWAKNFSIAYAMAVIAVIVLRKN